MTEPRAGQAAPSPAGQGSLGCFVPLLPPIPCLSSSTAPPKAFSLPCCPLCWLSALPPALLILLSRSLSPEFYSKSPPQHSSRFGVQPPLPPAPAWPCQSPAELREAAGGAQGEGVGAALQEDVLKPRARLWHKVSASSRQVAKLPTPFLHCSTQREVGKVRGHCQPTLGGDTSCWRGAESHPQGCCAHTFTTCSISSYQQLLFCTKTNIRGSSSPGSGWD